MKRAAPLHIPNGDGGAYKTELSLFRSTFPVRGERFLALIRAVTGLDDGAELLPDGGVTHIRLTWWHEPDPRDEPHSHPWPFKSYIIAGGYDESRIKNGTRVGMSHMAGEINVVPEGEYHTVDSVLKGTVTLMVCGPFSDGGAWGHLKDGVHVPAAPDPEFLRRLREINPHKRQRLQNRCLMTPTSLPPRPSQSPARS